MLNSVKTRLGLAQELPSKPAPQHFAAQANGPVFRSTRAKKTAPNSGDKTGQKSLAAKPEGAAPEIGLFTAVRAMRAHCQEHGIR